MDTSTAEHLRGDDSFQVPCSLRALGPDAYLTFLALHVMWARTWKWDWPPEMQADEWWVEPNPSLDPVDLAPIAMIPEDRVSDALELLRDNGYGLKPADRKVWLLYHPADS